MCVEGGAGARREGSERRRGEGLRGRRVRSQDPALLSFLRTPGLHSGVVPSSQQSPGRRSCCRPGPRMHVPHLRQRSPAFLAPGTGVVEDYFSTDQEWGDGFGMVQGHYIQAQLLRCGRVPHRPGPVLVRGLEIGDPRYKGCKRQRSANVNSGVRRFRLKSQLFHLQVVRP